jgi:hypothetical protein
MLADTEKQKIHISLTNGRQIIVPSVVLIVLAFLGTKAAFDQGNAIFAAPLVVAAVLLLVLLGVSAFRLLSVTVYEDRLTVRKPFREIIVRWYEVEYYRTSSEEHTTVRRPGPLAPLWMLILFPNGRAVQSFHSSYEFGLSNGQVVSLISDARLFELNSLIEPRLYEQIMPGMRAKFEAGENLSLHSLLRYSVNGLEGLRVKGTGKRRRMEPFRLTWDEYSGRYGEGVFTIMAGNQKAMSLPIRELTNFVGFKKIARGMKSKRELHQTPENS